MKIFMITLCLVTYLLTVTGTNRNHGRGFRARRQDNSRLEGKGSEVVNCEDFCERRERERHHNHDDHTACEQQRSDHKCKSFPRRLLGIPGLLPSPGADELHRKIKTLTLGVESETW